MYGVKTAQGSSMQEKKTRSILQNILSILSGYQDRYIVVQNLGKYRWFYIKVVINTYIDIYV